MSTSQTKTGFANINNAQIYYEIAGEGTPFVMIHAGVADSRQWNNEFTDFAQNYQVVRYDMRGYGKSEPVDGDFNHLSDLISLLDTLELHEPLVIMGCSMGGGLAMDFALAQSSRVKALIMVDSGPGGLKLDLPISPKFAEAEKAFEEGNLDLVAEIETQIWFDGVNRTPEQVNPAMRKLVYEMDHRALSHEIKQLGKRLTNKDSKAFNRLSELDIPVLVIVGAHDTPYTLAAADYMVKNIRFTQKAVIEDAAHLPNLDQPSTFEEIVKNFLNGLSD
jgi:pimeloyl-ACP methyl ester carboxylesterase